MRYLAIAFLSGLLAAACHTPTPASPSHGPAVGPVEQWVGPVSYGGRDGISLGLDATQGRPALCLRGNPFAEGWTPVPRSELPPSTLAWVNNATEAPLFVSEIIRRDESAADIAEAFRDLLGANDLIFSDVLVSDDRQTSEFAFVDSFGVIMGHAVVRTYEDTPEYAVRVMGIAPFWMRAENEAFVSDVASRLFYLRVTPEDE